MYGQKWVEGGVGQSREPKLSVCCLRTSAHPFLAKNRPGAPVFGYGPTKNAQGVVLMGGASRIWTFFKSNLLRVCDVDLLGLFNDISQVSSFVRSTAVCSATVRRDLLLQLLNSYHTISAVTALQVAAQLEVACPIFCVLRDEHLSIDRSVCPFFA